MTAMPATCETRAVLRCGAWIVLVASLAILFAMGVVVPSLLGSDYLDEGVAWGWSHVLGGLAILWTFGASVVLLTTERPE